MKLIILDRDGTINTDSDAYIKSADEWSPLPGALEAMARLSQAGWHLVIATNQSGLGRGLFDIAALNAMHQKMNRLLATLGGRVDAVFFCPHTPEDACDCRKPKPGLFNQIGQRYGQTLNAVPAVGDNLRDLQAAHTAGCVPHWVLTGKGEYFRSAHASGAALPPETPANTVVHRDLAAFAQYWLQQQTSPITGHPSGYPAAAHR